jgi:hypothetical protein
VVGGVVGAVLFVLVVDAVEFVGVGVGVRVGVGVAVDGVSGVSFVVPVVVLRPCREKTSPVSCAVPPPVADCWSVTALMKKRRVPVCAAPTNCRTLSNGPLTSRMTGTITRPDAVVVVVGVAVPVVVVGAGVSVDVVVAAGATAVPSLLTPL